MEVVEIIREKKKKNLVNEQVETRDILKITIQLRCFNSKIRVHGCCGYFLFFCYFNIF